MTRFDDLTNDRSDHFDDHLTDLLTRSGDRVEVRPDLARVVEATAVIPIDRRRRPAPRRRFVAAAAAAAIVAGGTIAVLAPSRDQGSVAYATALVEVAEGAPRLLVTADGWEVARADEFSAGEGEMAFTDGTHDLWLTWRPASTHGTYLDDRAADGDAAGSISVAGAEAALFRTEGHPSTPPSLTALWLSGDHSLEVRGDTFPTTDEYRSVVASMAQVDVDTWVAALPDSVIRVGDRPAIVDSMLEGVPIPSNVEVEDLRNEPTIKVRTQLGTQVTGAVSCGWLRQWAAATEAGDVAAADAAVEAMATTATWPILAELDPDGDWSELVWRIADQLGDGTMAANPVALAEAQQVTCLLGGQ